MSIFGRKEIAELKKELEMSKLRFEKLESENLQLNEKCSRYQSALTKTNKENEVLKRKNNEISSKALAVSGSSKDELAELDKKCAEYNKRLNKAEQQIEKYKKDSLDQQHQIEKLKSDYEDLAEILNLNNTSAEVDENNAFYYIRNIVKKYDYYMKLVYHSKSDFFHSFKGKRSHEYEMYKLLLNIIYELKSEDLVNAEGQNVKLSLFSQVRLADIVELQCGTFEKFKNGNNRNSICNMIEEKKPDFDNDDYRKTFLYPILSLHIDFLVCLNTKTLCVPLVAIELHGEDHDENSDKADKKRIWNDKFKKSIFESDEVKIQLMVFKNSELDSSDEKQNLKDEIYKAIISCIEKREDVSHK